MSRLDLLLEDEKRDGGKELCLEFSSSNIKGEKKNPLEF
jgi:hypothetical protein